jgi:hypothetical protein
MTKEQKVVVNSTTEIKPALVGEELKKLVIESVRKVFDLDSEHVIDECLKLVSKDKAAA